MRLLLVEDDPKLGPILQKDLQKNGFAVDLTPSAIDGEFMGNEINYDIIILDIGLPEKNGIEVLKDWRSEGMLAPVIILSARSSWEEKVDGFKAGADDYLAKPFHFKELIQRLNAIIKRASGHLPQQQVFNGIAIDDDKQSLKLESGEEYLLTGIEYRLLRFLVMNPDKIHSKTALTEHVYNQDSDKDSNVIEVYIRRLRQKLPEGSITTQRGQGYIYRG